MNPREIEEQIEVLKAATLKASRSKKTARDFLVGAGILSASTETVTSTVPSHRGETSYAMKRIK